MFDADKTHCHSDGFRWESLEHNRVELQMGPRNSGRSINWGSGTNVKINNLLSLFPPSSIQRHPEV